MGAGYSGQCGHGVRVTQRVSPAPGKKTESNRGFISVKSAKSYCKKQVIFSSLPSVAADERGMAMTYHVIARP